MFLVLMNRSGAIFSHFPHLVITVSNVRKGICIHIYSEYDIRHRSNNARKGKLEEAGAHKQVRRFVFSVIRIQTAWSRATAEMEYPGTDVESRLLGPNDSRDRAPNTPEWRNLRDRDSEST